VPLERSRGVGTLQEESSEISHTGFCQFFSCLCTGIAIFELLYYFIGIDIYFIGSDLY
jgi:hypothetical protein